jgi:hypothetical protein
VKSFHCLFTTIEIQGTDDILEIGAGGETLECRTEFYIQLADGLNLRINRFKYAKGE